MNIYNFVIVFIPLQSSTTMVSDDVTQPKNLHKELNEIETFVAEDNDQPAYLPNVAIIEKTVPYFLQDFDQDTEELFNQETEKKNQAQIMAAKRCLQTNLFLGFLFIIVFGFIMLSPSSRRGYYSAVILTIMTGALPTFTTIANFGTVQYVISQYLQYFEKLEVFHFKMKQ